MTIGTNMGLMAIPLILSGGLWQSAEAQDAQPISDVGAGSVAQNVAPAVIAPLPGEGNPAPRTQESAPLGLSPDIGVQQDAPVAAGLQPIQSDDGIRYVSGGVGEDERAALDALSGQFNLRLLFAKQGSGEYLAAVGVNIKDTQGASVLTAESQGPWFFVQLAPGDYAVEVTPHGSVPHEPQHQTAHVGGSGQTHLDFYWR